jgi:hypothetical protein
MLNEINRGEVLTNLLGWMSAVLERFGAGAAARASFHRTSG